MNNIQFSYGTAVATEAIHAYKQQVAQAQEQLVNGTGISVILRKIRKHRIYNFRCRFRCCRII